MSPEAARGERVDQRADLFSLGVVLYAMLTGHGPHDKAGPVMAPSRNGAEGCGADLDVIVLRAIEERAAARYQSADEFLSDLKNLSRRSRPPEAWR
jgi:serine/threonine-protein kinase